MGLAPGERDMTRKWGAAYQWVQLYLEQRYGRVCFFCGERDKPLIVEHEDNDPKNYNPENLHWACWSCNQRKNPRGPVPQGALPRERENGSGRQAEWSSEEGRRSDKMTYRYRQRLYHPETGLFKNAGQVFPLDWLANVLPDELKIGKSTTYYKYIKEDVAAQYLEGKEIDGETKLERTLKPYPLWKLGMESQ